MDGVHKVLVAVLSSTFAQGAFAADGAWFDSATEVALPSVRFGSGAFTISYDGSMIGGVADERSYLYDLIGKTRPFVGANNSSIRGLSADGRTAVGVFKKNRAFVTKLDGTTRDIGTLHPDGQSGVAFAHAVSADGDVVVGQTAESLDVLPASGRAFRYKYSNREKTDLGTLQADGMGAAAAYGVSRGGNVIVGVSTIGTGSGTAGGIRHAFKYQNNKMKDLGSLVGAAGSSVAHAVSYDGEVIVGRSTSGAAGGEDHAFRYKDNIMQDLGTLRTDGAGFSFATATNEDGSIVVGASSPNQSGAVGADVRAFVWKDGQMQDLGTLESDGSGWSAAHAVSGDGKVVAGTVYSPSLGGQERAVLWKLKKDAVIPVDKDASNFAMANTADRGFKTLSLYQSALNSLNNTRCSIQTDNNACVGVFTWTNAVQEKYRAATGVFGSVRLPMQNWLIGGAVNFANKTKLIENYDPRGKSRPSVSIFTQYASHPDESGLNVALSAAYLTQDLTITRDKLQNTEAGKGESKIKAYQGSLALSYGFNLSDRTYLSPSLAVVHHKITRSAYAERSQAEFPAYYGEMGNKQTSAKLGLDGRYRLNNTIQFDGQVAANLQLSSKKDAFTGHIDYIGSHVYQAGESRRTRLSAKTGMNIFATKHSTIRADLGWMQTDYGNDASHVGLSYSYSL